MHRVAPQCVHVDQCGGCTLQHVSAEAQLRSKEAAVLTTLAKIGRVTPDEVLPAWSGPAYGYRGRARWSVNSQGSLGYRAAHAHRVVTVSQCPVLMPALERALRDLQDAAGPSSRGPKRRTQGETAALSAVTDGERVAVQWLGDAGPRSGGKGVVWSDPVAVPGSGLQEADGFWLHPGVFSQANPAGNEALRAQVRTWLAQIAPYETVVELYAGSGNFTRVLAEIVAHADPGTGLANADPGTGSAQSASGTSPRPSGTGVAQPRSGVSVMSFEASEDAVALARRLVPANVRPEVASAEDVVRRTDLPAADVVFVDPPRAGLSVDVANRLTTWARRALLYVSCDPATFARDAGRWQTRGWRLHHLRVFDLYPQTAHVELAGWFRPDGPDTFAGSPG